LTNALKYAHPRNFETRLSCNANELRLELHDDGDGFKVSEQHDGFGLAGMRERVEQMGGKLTIASSRGKGTRVVVALPYNHGATRTRASSCSQHSTATKISTAPFRPARKVICSRMCRARR